MMHSKQYISRSYHTSTFNAIHFYENPFTCECEIEKEKPEAFQISPFYWPFSNDIMAVKGLRSGNTSVLWRAVQASLSLVVVESSVYNNNYYYRACT